ncbi:MAG: M13 family metallopeptidase [Alphaproteobacteria bacterium]|nr:M13 family metallopeptidase [Alphaproteobacteria bacterium]
MKSTLWNIVGIIAVAIAVLVAHNTNKEKEMSAGIKVENMDLTVKPGDDFYDYATRGWQVAHPIPDDFSRYGAFEVLRDTNLERTRKIAENDTGKIGTLYDIIMNTEKRNADGVKPVEKFIAEIDGLKNTGDLAKYLGEMSKYSSAFWGDGVALDEMDSEHFLFNIVQGGTGLSRDYYFDTDEKSIEIRKKYKEFIAKQLKHFGIKGDADKIYALEERMAKSFHTKEVLRDPHANYHKMSIAEIKEKFTGFDWDTFLVARNAQSATHINIAQPDAIKESIAIMNDTDFDLIKTYLKYRIVGSADSLLDDTAYDISFDFYNRTMAGQKEPKPRWKRAVGMLDGSLGEEIGRLYVKEYFSEKAKKRMQVLVKNLQRAYAMRMEKLEWMSDETKEKALEKLSTFKAKIGYPDKWRDYSKLEINPELSLWENMVNVALFEDAFWMDKIGKENDSTLWYMNAHEVNAYYDPSTNEICFPAGILQYPFFDMGADDAFNYGAIGAVIGHEMTHGFDDSGRKFDKDGNLRDWWTEQDAKRFDERAGVMREFFDKIKINDQVHANGEFTLGENLADYGGVTIAYTAYKEFGTPSNEAGGLTPDMRFFVAYSGAWAQNIRPDEALRLTKIDEHSLGKNRVNGILVHIDAWYDAFDIKPGDKMFVLPGERVKLW